MNELPATPLPIADAAAAPAARDPAAPPALTPHDPMIVLGFRCLQREFSALVARQPQRDMAPSTKDVHQMRIATRRLRVALRLFGHMLPRRQAKQLKHELRWFAHALGSVRDLDVHAEILHAYVQTLPAEQGQQLGDYELHLRRIRTAARNELTALFGTERYEEFVATFTDVLDGAPSRAAVRRWKSFRISDGAAEFLKRSRKRVFKLGRKLGAEAAAKDLHRLRIRAKRLRYELEFFLEVYPDLAQAAAATKAIQDLLGACQDSYMATEHLAEYTRALRRLRQKVVTPQAAIGQWVAHQAQQGHDARLAFPLAWTRFVNELKNTPLGVH
jgi:triphosphatase